MIIKYKLIITVFFFPFLSSCNALNGLGRDCQSLGNLLSKTGNSKANASASYLQAPQSVHKAPVQQAQARLAASPAYAAPVYTTVKPAYTGPVQSTSHTSQSIVKRLTGNMKSLKTSPYTVTGVRYTPQSAHSALSFSETGVASFYDTHSGKNAIGDSGNYGGLTAAHKTLPLPSIVRVTNLDNRKSIIVRVNDRGPFGKGRTLSLSSTTKNLLGENGKGLINVRMEVIAVGDVNQITR